MSFLGFFLEKETAAWHTMFLRQGLYGDGVVLVYCLVLLGVNVVEKYRVLHALTEIVYLWLQYLLQLAVSVNVQWGSASQQSESRYQSYQSETMVAMQVRNEYVVYEREVYMPFSQLQLRSFAAIYHELFVAYSHYL